MYKREKKKIKTEQRGFFVRTEFREWKTQQNIERERERKGIQEIKEKYFRRLFFLAHLFWVVFIYIYLLYIKIGCSSVPYWH
jgi:Flp pilus assembly protein TadB